MANIIKTKNSSVASAAPVTPLAAGELAVNTTDLKLFVGDGATNHLLLDANAEELPVGTDGQTLWNNAGTWEANGDITTDSSGNLSVTGNIGAVDVDASGNVGAVDVNASGDIDATGSMTSENGVSVGAKEIGVPTQAIANSIISVTQAEYDAIVTPDANTLYIVI